MDLNIRNKVALVIGGSAGMGKGAALALARDGARIAIAARDPDRIKAAVADIERAGAPKAKGYPCDLFSADGVDRLVSSVHGDFGRLDILVNAVGEWYVTGEDSVLSFTDDLWNKHFESVLMTCVRACRAAIPIMTAQGGGAVINIAAQSSEHYYPRVAPYSALKAAMVHVTKNLGKEFARAKVRINAIRPGWILTEAQEKELSAQKKPGQSWEALFDELMGYWSDVSWMGRFGTAEEIGDAVAFLASDRASYINAAVIAVDGGSY